MPAPGSYLDLDNPYLQHMVLAWDVHALSNSAEEVFSISVASTGHAHVHCRFQGSYDKIAKLMFSYLNVRCTLQV